MTAEWASYVSGLLSIQGRVRASLARFTRNPADTDELLQETYARLLAVDPEAVRTIRSVPAFAMVAAKRVAIDWLRRRKRWQVDTVDDLDVLCLPGGATLTEDLVNAHQEIERVLRKIRRLPPRCSEVYMLRAVFGFSQSEIAPLLGISVHTVERHLAKGRRQVSRPERFLLAVEGACRSR